MDEKIQYPLKFNLTLVRKGPSNLILIFAFIGVLIGGPALGIFLFQHNILLVTLVSVGILFVFFKFDHLFLIKYTSQITFLDTHFEIDDERYEWKDVEWYDYRFGNKFMMGFSIGIKNSKNRVSLFFGLKKSINHTNGITMIEAFENILNQKNIVTRNYYNAPKWRRVAKLALWSNLIPVGIAAIGVIEIEFIIALIVIWVFTSLPTAIIIYSNQN